MPSTSWSSGFFSWVSSRFRSAAGNGGAWWLAWVVLVADLGYTFTFGRHDATIFSRALIADIAFPVLLFAQLPWLLTKGERRVGRYSA
jgi:hypothetical protein